MKEFFVGLCVVLAFLILSGVAVFLLPLLMVMGVFLQYLLSVAFLIFAIWLIGKITLWVIKRLRNK